MKLFCELAFVDDSWQRDVSIGIDERGFICSVQPESQRDADQERVAGPVIPGMPNVHSHAFQRAFAGLSEFRTSQQDSFWTWRELMYRFLEQLTPEDIYIIARQLFIEMVGAGYTCVGEFQYIHKENGGCAFSQKEIVSDQIVRAASDVGISICLLPVIYQRPGFAGGNLAGGQKRFFMDDDEYVEVLARLKSSWQEDANVTLGMAVHSLRAVDPAKIQPIRSTVTNMLGDCPIHIHVSEQQKEVDDCLAATHRTPIELLAAVTNLDDRWCLIHATHATPDELTLISKNESVVGLCPTTEANLGDGFFATDRFKQLGGRIAIGSDSQITIDPRSELRLMEYETRLREQQRAILCDENKSCGQWLYSNAAVNGARAIGRPTGKIDVGYRADLVVLDNDHPAFFAHDPVTVFDKLIFFELQNSVADVMVGGKWVIRESRHSAKDDSRAAFAGLIKKLN